MKTFEELTWSYDTSTEAGMYLINLGDVVTPDSMDVVLIDTYRRLEEKFETQFEISGLKKHAHEGNDLDRMVFYSLKSVDDHGWTNKIPPVYKFLKLDGELQILLNQLGND